MLRILTAGESHGKYLVGILEGLPAGIEIGEEFIREYLKRRRGGYGRGRRTAGNRAKRTQRLRLHPQGNR